MPEETDIQHVEVAAVSSNAIESQERAEIDIQISTAKKYPRSIERFQKDAQDLIRSSRQVASECVYNRPVGKEGNKMKFAEGPSIRLAEIVASCYGNLRVATIITEVTPRQVKSQGMAFDLEKNYAVKKDCMETTVTKDGRPFSERMRVVVAKACQSKAMRDAIFGVIPRAVCNPLIELAKKTALGDGKTLDEARVRLMEWIESLNIDAQRVWDAIGVGGKADVGTDELTVLAGLRTAINDGDATVNEAFPKAAADVAGKSTAERIKNHFEQSSQKPKVEKPKRGRPKKKAEKPKKEISSETAPESPEQAEVADKPEAAPAKDVETEPAPPEGEPTEPEPETANFICQRCERTCEKAGDDGKCPFCFGELKEIE